MRDELKRQRSLKKAMKLADRAYELVLQLIKEVNAWHAKQGSENQDKAA